MIPIQAFWPRFKRKFSILKQLRTPADLVLFVRIFIFGALVPFLMRQQLPQVEQWLVPAQTPSSITPEYMGKVIRYTDGALRLGQPITQVRCLTRGVTLYYFLSRAGMDVSLYFGAGKVDGRFVAHCWLETDGQPFAEPRNPYEYYQITYVIPSPA